MTLIQLGVHIDGSSLESVKCSGMAVAYLNRGYGTGVFFGRVLLSAVSAVSEMADRLAG